MYTHKKVTFIVITNIYSIFWPEEYLLTSFTECDRQGMSYNFIIKITEKTNKCKKRKKNNVIYQFNCLLQDGVSFLKTIHWR